MQLSPTIFKAYDVRGIVPSTLDEEVAQALGRAFGTAARKAGETTVDPGEFSDRVKPLLDELSALEIDVPSRPD